MSYYVKTIVTAILVFPIIALLFTIPYILYQYRKYGSISFLRGLIIYSFILYLISAYFLVILPLPSITEVAKLKTPRTQLIPFHFITSFINETSFIITDPNTYLKALSENCFYQVLYNIILTMPFGIYLRYYYKCSLRKTIFSSFLLSLFFEVTQLSGLYGIYPRGYRLFDIDDLILNTTGGILGYFMEPLLLLVLPSRDKIDEIAYRKGEIVSFNRRLVAFNSDLIIFATMITIFQVILNGNEKITFIQILIGSAIFYYIIIPLITCGQTFGKRFLKLKIANSDNKNAKPHQILIRNLLLYALYVPFPIYLFLMFNIIITPVKNEFTFLIFIILFTIIIFIYYLILFYKVAIKKRLLLYERISNTKNISIIKRKNEKEIVQISPFRLDITKENS